MVLDVGWHIGSPYAAEASTFCARPEHQLTASGGCSSSPFGNTQRTNAISSFVWLNLHSQPLCLRTIMGLLQEPPTDSFFHKEKPLGSLAQLGCLCTELQHRHLVFSGPPQDISTSAVVGRSAARKPMPPFPPPQSAAAPTLPQAAAPSVPQQTEPQPQATAPPQAEPVPRPPMPVR
jgi:hypothetical protein